ncbi:cell division protein FtsA [Lacticaseibacillus thailandensis]|uniref:Cell division protein FtsA n=1 Tax=Lacticaseibacillus thailandensis DSM 22698 = JCM 13996 TaxID=1423810 RepID=A0A0R2CHP0_9LACO|nr:cell division protein FtsA [Lacticaseibacillus thailandensis]KRM87931.1 ATPase for cell division [Lacticaseibacillus thailandensis DSM 22698 = JCM 13996]
MANQDIYVGLDIGTTSIKVIAAEVNSGQMSVIGMGNQHSSGLSRGVIVDIDQAATAIKAAVQQAADKASITINQVVVGVPASLLQIERVTGMIAVGETSKEINDADVRNVAATAMMRNLPPEREVIAVIPSQFTVDGFDGIQDPRGMIGVRVEMQGLLLTVPKTVVHNIKRAVAKAGLAIQQLVVNPLALGEYILSDGEQDFGTVIVDLGGGQTTAAVIHDHKLKFTYADREGGENITKDISIVLNTDYTSAEKLKRDFGNADSLSTSEDETFPVTVVGKPNPAMISEKYLSEIIEARVTQIFNRVHEALEDAHALDLPGGIVITGGTAALPGITALAKDVFQCEVKLYMPSEVGLRHPSFSQALALIKAAAAMTDIDKLANSAVSQADASAGQAQQSPTEQPRLVRQPAAGQTQQEQTSPDVADQQEEQPKKKTGKKIRHFFSSFFE